MPKKGISKYQPTDFEPAKKNPVSLGDDSNLDNDFKPLNIGGINTGLEFSLDEIRSTVSNFKTLKESTEQLHVTKIRGNRTPSWLTPMLIFQQYDETNDEIGLSLNMLANGSCVWKSVDDGSGAPSQMSFEAGGIIHFFLRDTSVSSFHFANGSFGATTNELINIRYDNKTFFYPNGTSNTSYFSIELGTNAATTLKTLDYGADTDASLTMDVDGDIVIDSATGNITVKDDGGNYTPSSDYHIATKKYVDDNAGGGGDMTGVDLTAGTGISIDSETNTTSGDYSATITCNVEGTEIASTGETGTAKFLRIDGDNSSSWQIPPNDNTNQLTTFDVDADSGTAETIAHGSTLTLTGGTGINTTVSSTDTVTFALSSGAALSNLGGGSGTTFLKKDGTWATPTDTNTQNTTTLSFVDSSNDIILRNTTGGAGSGTDDIKFVAGSNVTLTHTDADNITIASANDNTTYTGGTNLTLAGTTFNVDDAFLKNDADDTTTGTITAGGFTTTGTWTFDEYTSGTVGITSIQDSGTTCVDEDSSLLTAAAIVNKIESYGYTTNTGDITGVDLSVTSPITISSETNTTSGSYSATLGLDDPANLTELTESTDATDDKILLWDESGGSWKYMTLDNLQDSIDTTGGGGGSGDMTGVDLTGGVGISIDSETNTTSGDYSATITCNVEGTEISSTGETGGNKYLREDGDGTCSWQSVSGLGGATNYITDDSDDTMAGTLTIDKNSTATTTTNILGLDIDLDHTGAVAAGQVVSTYGARINVNDDAPTHVQGHYPIGLNINVTSNDTGQSFATGLYQIVKGGDYDYGILQTVGENGDGSTETIGISQMVTNDGIDYLQKSSADGGDYFSMRTIANGATTLATVDDDGTNLANLTLQPQGDIILDAADDITIDSAGKTTIIASEGVEFDGGAAGFDRLSYTDATTTTVEFRQGNKAHLDMTGGNVTSLNMRFPSFSGNFTLVVQQDSSTRTIANYYAYDSALNLANNDGGTAGAIRWQGGSAPDLTDGGNKRDILTFYWDADEEVCYGVASLDF